MANEIRRRYDFVAGVLSAGMLTSDTLMQGLALADLPAVGATEQVALSLFRTDVTGRVTQKEIVWVTAHTAAATSATVTRARDGTTAQTWSAGDRFSLTTIASDLLVVCTTATRPSQPYTGMQLYETDSIARPIWTGAAWEYKWNALGPAGTNFDGFTIRKGLTVNSANIMHGLSHRSNDKDLLLYGYDGVTFRNWLYFSWDALSVAVHQKLDMGQNDIRLFSAANNDHKLTYRSTAPNGPTDGPCLFGYTNAYLCTTNGGENWTLRADFAGDVYARAKLKAGTDAEIQSIMRCGQGRHIAANRFHWMGDGNDLHANWGSGLQFYVDVTNVKTFVIDHPVDDERHLVHACIEGPEAAVIYRGQSQLEGGWVEIRLPEYFEALCAEEGRSVQLTCIADDPLDEWCPVLHATYPKNGRFWVGLGSGMVINDQRFWWEVKAVRKDVAPLNVEPLRDAIEVLGSGPYTYMKER